MVRLMGDGRWELGDGRWERKVRSWALPCLVSPFLTGNPSKGEPQVKHLFKTVGSWGIRLFQIQVKIANGWRFSFREATPTSYSKFAIDRVPATQIAATLVKVRASRFLDSGCGASALAEERWKTASIIAST